MSSASEFPVRGVNSTVLNLSDNLLMEELITNIPFFAIGLLGFAVATVLFLVRRSTRPGLYVIGAMITAFIGSIFDFNQLLARANGMLYIAGAFPLIVVREVAFAISVCFRFLYFWYYCNTPPRTQPAVRSEKGSMIVPKTGEEYDSAVWGRLGLAGQIFRFTLLALCIAVGALQIVWRLESKGLSIAYEMETGMEIALSGIFLIKILVNCAISPVTPRWKNYQHASAIIIAICIGAAVASGNLVLVFFSETSLGRFLQAIEMYCMALFIMIRAFQSPGRNGAAMEPRKSIASFIGPTPEVHQLRPARVSTAERLTTWLSTRASIQQPKVDRDTVRLWNQTDPESSSAAPGGGSLEKIPSADTTSPISAREIASWRITSSGPPADPPASPPALSPPTVKIIAGSTRDAAPSPIYGLNGVRVSPDPDTRPELAYGLQSRIKHDDAIRMLSPTTGSIKTSSTLSSSRIKPLTAESSRTEFSLQDFPQPPGAREAFFPRNAYKQSKAFSNVSAFSTASGKGVALVLDDVAFTLVPPQPLSQDAAQSVPQSVVSTGSRLDVTSFIGGLTQGKEGSDSVRLSDAIPSAPLANTRMRNRSSTIDSASSPMTVRLATNVRPLLTRPVLRQMTSPLAASSHPFATSQSPAVAPSSQSSPRVPISGPVVNPSRVPIESPESYQVPRPVPPLATTPGKEGAKDGNTGFV